MPQYNSTLYCVKPAGMKCALIIAVWLSLICRHKAQHSTADEIEDKGEEGGDYQVPHSAVETARAAHGL